MDLSRCDPKGKRVETLDTNNDGKPDVWKMYVPTTQGGQTVDVLVCKEVDLNHDGKVDELAYYDNNGNRVLEKFDLDFDGRIDETIYYEGGKKVRSEFDTDFDDKPDIWKYYEGDRLVRVERDTNHDGRVDYWEYYEGGKLDRIGYDTTGSGRVDKWDRAPEETEAPEPAAGATGGTGTQPGGAAPAAAQTKGGLAPGQTLPTPDSPATTAPAPDGKPAKPSKKGK
ncbi:MAG TPA: hypothetical protein VKN99_03160 [Polyangia bacterium]|nr:hypothetical protein [Polyangia bacterium]